MDIVIKNGTVITMDAGRRIIKEGAVAISDGRIAGVGTIGELADERANVEIDAGNKIVLPGLVNPHVHLGYSLAKGCGDDLPFAAWIPIVFRVEDGYGGEDWYLASLLSMVEMIKSGTTCCADTNIYQEIDDIVRAVDDSGIRSVLAKNITDITPEELERNPWLGRARDTAALTLDAAVEDHGRLNGAAGGRLQVRFSPQIWPACSTEGYKRVAEVSRQMGVGKLIHHTEAKEWGAFVQQEYGKPATMMLHDFGILGPDTLLENASLLSDEEMALISETKTCFNYLPTPNMKNYLGVLDLSKLVADGVPTSIGTSGGLINNVNDLFREMKTLALQQRAVKETPDALPAETILEMATIGGAKCLGLDDEIGSIEVGKRADVIVIDAYQPHMVPVLNPVSTIVYCANGGDVEASIIDGKIVMADRRLETMDEKALLARVVEEGARTIARTGIPDEPHARPKWDYVERLSPAAR